MLLYYFIAVRGSFSFTPRLLLASKPPRKATTAVVRVHSTPAVSVNHYSCKRVAVTPYKDSYNYQLCQALFSACIIDQ